MKHILIVGPRHVGKSTLIRRILDELNMPAFGFYTKKESSLADEALGEPIYIYNAGATPAQTPDNLLGYCKNYHTYPNVEAFDRYAARLRRPVPAGSIVVLDELGSMETHAKEFTAAVFALLDGDAPLIAAVKDKENPFLNDVRSHPNCKCFYITAENRNALLEEILIYIKKR